MGKKEITVGFWHDGTICLWACEYQSPMSQRVNVDSIYDDNPDVEVVSRGVVCYGIRMHIAQSNLDKGKESRRRKPNMV